MKKTNRKNIILSSLLVMALALIASFSTNIKADTVTTAPWLYKEIHKTPGTTTPAVTFTYEFTAVSFNNDTSDLSFVPVINDMTLSFSSTDNTDSNATTTNIIEVKKGLAISLPSTYDRAGEYVYTVVESSNDFTPGANDSLTDSDAKYEIHVFVKNNASGVEIEGVTVYQLLNDAGTTDGVSSAKIEADQAGEALKFISTYSKTATLSVYKEVVGDYANKKKEFTFVVNFAAAGNVTGSNSYSYYISENGTKVPGSDTAYTINGTGSVTVQLTHNQAAVFEGLPTGTKFYAIENKDTKYTSKGEISSNGVVTSNISQTDTSGNLLLNATANENADTLIGEGINYAKAINTENNISVTGVIFDNLPFLILIVIGATGVGYYIIKRKRAFQ